MRPRRRWTGPPRGTVNAAKERQRAGPYRPTPPLDAEDLHPTTPRPPPPGHPHLAARRAPTQPHRTPRRRRVRARTPLRPDARRTPPPTGTPPHSLPRHARRRRRPAPAPHPWRRPMTAPRRPAVRMCARCQCVTGEPVLVHEVHAATGPGFNVYACQECAAHYPPPLVDELELLGGEGELEPPARRSRLTLRVYRVRAGGEIVGDRGEVTVLVGSAEDQPARSSAYPPCRCGQCRTVEAN